MSPVPSVSTCYILQVYLIEVNTSPALYRHGQVLTDLLPVLIEEVVQKVSMPTLTLMTLGTHAAAC